MGNRPQASQQMLQAWGPAKMEHAEVVDKFTALGVPAAANHSAAVPEAGNTKHRRTQQPGLEQGAATSPC